MSSSDTQPHVAPQPLTRAADAGSTGGSFLAAMASYHGDSHAVALVGALLLMLAAYCSMWGEAARRAKRRRGAPQKFSTPAMYRTRSKEMLVSLVPVPEKALLTNRELRASSVPQCSFYPPPTCDDEEEDERRIAAEEEEYEEEDCGEQETGMGVEVEVVAELEHRREAHDGAPLVTATHAAGAGVVVTQPRFVRTKTGTKVRRPEAGRHEVANDDADVVAFVAVAGGDSGGGGKDFDSAMLRELLRDEGAGSPQ